MALTEIQLKICRFHNSLSRQGSRPLLYVIVNEIKEHLLQKQWTNLHNTKSGWVVGAYLRRMRCMSGRRPGFRRGRIAEIESGVGAGAIQAMSCPIKHSARSDANGIFDDSNTLQTFVVSFDLWKTRWMLEEKKTWKNWVLEKIFAVVITRHRWYSLTAWQGMPSNSIIYMPVVACCACVSAVERHRSLTPPGFARIASSIHCLVTLSVRKNFVRRTLFRSTAKA